MIEKEVAELRRRFRPDKSNITHIRGCYVNESGEIVAEFNQALSLLSQEEGEKLLALLRRALSGALGKNLLDIPFTTAQVVDSEEHRLLMSLRDSSLSVLGVAQSVGYGSASQFTAAFRRQYGMTPAKYRKDV